jgi:alanine dehydrogenase
MLIGVPKEIKPDEYRVALTPAGTEALTSAGHQVLIEAAAGLGSGFTDDFYSMAGAQISDSADDIWVRADMVMKVKEPIEAEWPKIRNGQVLFTYFHLASTRIDRGPPCLRGRGHRLRNRRVARWRASAADPDE